MPERALEGVTVVEIGKTGAAAYAAKLMADLGADEGRCPRPCTGLGAAATASADHGAPPMTGMIFFSSFSTACNSPISAGAQNATAVPSAPARAVRPIRWT